MKYNSLKILNNKNIFLTVLESKIEMLGTVGFILRPWLISIHHLVVFSQDSYLVCVHEERAISLVSLEKGTHPIMRPHP